MTDTSIDLTGLRFPGRNGVDEHVVDAPGTFDDALKQLADAWLPWVECHQCGRWKTCKFAAPPHPANPLRSLDKQCGVALHALRLFLESSLPTLKGGDKATSEAVLLGAYHLSQYVFLSEQFVGTMLDDGMVQWFGDETTRVFANLKYLRKHLDGMSSALRGVPRFHLTESVVLVEGNSELRFLNRMKASGLAWFHFQHFDAYDGNGNRRQARIEMLLRNYEKRGFNVFMQADADGGSAEQVRDGLVKTLKLAPETIFVFKRDFESSVPPALMAHGLGTLLELDQGQAADAAKYLAANEPLERVINRFAPKTKLASIKVELAATLADALANTPWFHDNAFMDSELGRFLDFVRKA